MRAHFLKTTCFELLLFSSVFLAQAAAGESILPPGVESVFSLESAFRESTPTRERVCLNGLWRWQPAKDSAGAIPTENWGYFKVPGCWPGIGDYMQSDCQTVFAHPTWKNEKLGAITFAWYQREMTIPAEWTGRRIALSTSYVNSFATVYVDGAKAGDLTFPAGEVDLSAFCKPGQTHVLSLGVVALPLKGVMLSYVDTAAAREVKGSVNRRGLCGDVFLAAGPRAEALGAVRVMTSLRKNEITLQAALERLDAAKEYRIAVVIEESNAPGAAFQSPPFKAAALQEGRFAFTQTWKAAKQWDLHTPQNTCIARFTLQDAAGATLDQALPERFGAREFWIDGKDFYLNGSRLFLSMIPFDNASINAGAASYAGAAETFRRLKRSGINYVYSHNYDCEPGSHLAFTEILRAADDVGMLFGLTQPHFSHYDWKAPDADEKNGYARHAAFYADVAGSHPSVVFYSMSHNATGYNEDMNPDLIDGVSNPRDGWSRNNAKLAVRAEALVNRIDPSRIVYHHAGGNLGTTHNSNFYPNFTPIQELCDWFQHWSKDGVKPAFTCEYGGPFTWDWTMYRGWYKGQRNFGSAKVPWEFCFAEWNAQFLGDRAFDLSDPEKRNLRWEAEQFRKGSVWFRWDYPFEIGSNVFEDRNTVMGLYITDTWRAFRTLGLSGNSPWEFGHFWRLKNGVDRNRRELPVDWAKLQRPGYSADYAEFRFRRMDVAYGAEDWQPTAAGEALLRNNQPILAYIAGKPSNLTGKDHIYASGERVEKQIVVINNSREPIAVSARGSHPIQTPDARIEPGQQARLPIEIAIPENAGAGAIPIAVEVSVQGGETLKDAFTLHVLPRSEPVKVEARVALFDPAGETAKLLAACGVAAQSVNAQADLSNVELLVIGKNALTRDGPGPDLSRVRNGLRVVVFEQSAEVLEKRFGFRVAEYGLRQAYPRVPDHPALKGLSVETLHDWRGEATLSAPRLKYELNPKFNGAPSVKWCGIDVTRACRCGNRGNVASVLIEKPARGDFLPIVDGGYSLQYSPLLEFREGSGVILFCQMDVSGRTENDPAAVWLAGNLVSYASAWKPAPRRTAVYAGDEAGRTFLDASGVKAAAFDATTPLTPQHALIVGPGAGGGLAARKAEVQSFVQSGGALFLLGLSESEANAFLPFRVTMKKGEHINAYFAPQGGALRGIGPADTQNRDVREISLMAEGATRVGAGVLAAREGVVFFQTPPWTFDYSKQYNVKRTFRRAAFLTARVLGNLGVSAPTPLLERFSRPQADAKEQRWLDSYYLDVPEEMDDPYRFFRW